MVPTKRKDYVMSLSSKGLLVIMNVSQWTARKLDRRAASTVSSVHAADRAAGNYSKKLLPGATELERVSHLARALRGFLYDETLPWLSDGTRIIASKNYLSFAREFSLRKREFETAVAEFIAAYPQLRLDAQSRLGDLFSPSDYPSEDYLRQAFRCEINYLPLPDVGDFRTDLSEEDRAAFEMKMKETESVAMRDVWERLHKVVSKAAQTLTEPEAKFKDTLIGNINEICAALPRLNITDDPKLEEMRVSVERIVAGVSPDVCRDNLSERQKTASALRAQLNQLDGIMGAFSAPVKNETEGAE
jgi:hypothetical protein